MNQHDNGGLYDFDLNDFGVEPDFDKAEMNGKVIIVHGVSEAVMQRAEYPKGARSLLWNFPTDIDAFDPDGTHYGMLLSEDSLPIKNTLTMMQRGRVPFPARIVYRQKESNKAQSYWMFERVLIQYDADGTLVDPNEPIIGKKAK